MVSSKSNPAARQYDQLVFPPWFYTTTKRFIVVTTRPDHAALVKHNTSLSAFGLSSSPLPHILCQRKPDVPLYFVYQSSQFTPFPLLFTPLSPDRRRNHAVLTQQSGVEMPYLDTKPPNTHRSLITDKVKMESFQSLGANYATAIKLIDEAHAGDPRTVPSDDGTIPFELRYARKMTRWLAARKPDASPALQLACRAQHFRR